MESKFGKRHIIEGFEEYDPRFLTKERSVKYPLEICALEVFREFVEKVPALSDVDFTQFDGEYNYELSNETEPYVFMITELKTLFEELEKSFFEEISKVYNYIIVLPVGSSENFRFWLCLKIGLSHPSELSMILDYHYFNLMDIEGNIVIRASKNSEVRIANEVFIFSFLIKIRETFSQYVKMKYFGCTDEKLELINNWIESNTSKFSLEAKEAYYKNVIIYNTGEKMASDVVDINVQTYDPGCSEFLLNKLFDLLNQENPKDKKRNSLVDNDMIQHLKWQWFGVGETKSSSRSWSYTINNIQLLLFASEFIRVRDKKKRGSITQEQLIDLILKAFPNAFSKRNATSRSLSSNISSSRESYASQHPEILFQGK